jgi:hypothetical protein
VLVEGEEGREVILVEEGLEKLFVGGGSLRELPERLLLLCGEEEVLVEGEEVLFMETGEEAVWRVYLSHA